MANNDVIPFVWTPEQLELKSAALTRTTTFVAGPAGTGKTTAIKHALDDLGHDDFIVVAPTHRACAVLRAKGVRHVMTLHKAFLLPVYAAAKTNPEKLKYDWTKHIYGGFVALHHLYEDEDDHPKFALCVIDEMSMLPDVMVMWVLEAARECGGRVVAMGDDMQLHPVFGKPSFERYKPDLLLTIGQRHAGAPAIAGLAARIRNRKVNVEKELKSYRDTFKPVPPRSRFLREFDEGIGIELSFPRKLARARGEGWRSLMGRKPGRPVAACGGFQGDIITLTQGSDGELYNARSWRIMTPPVQLRFTLVPQFSTQDADKARIRRVGWLATSTALDDPECEQTFAFSLDDPDLPIVDPELSDEEDVLKAPPDVWIAIEGIDDYGTNRLDVAVYFVPVMFGYASTIHRAQGGEWDVVYLNDPCAAMHQMKREQITQVLMLAHELDVGRFDNTTLGADGGPAGLGDPRGEGGALEIPPPWEMRSRVYSRALKQHLRGFNPEKHKAEKARLFKASERWGAIVQERFHEGIDYWADDAVRRIVYTGVTRAKRRLFVVRKGEG